MSTSAAHTLTAPAGRNSDIYMAVALIGILSLMIIPLPSFLLDLFLAANITMALVILLVCLYTIQPLDFSVFPSMLSATLCSMSSDRHFLMCDSLLRVITMAVISGFSMVCEVVPSLWPICEWFMMVSMYGPLEVI